jgi:SAM-dependent methyltransferase
MWGSDLFAAEAIRIREILLAQGAVSPLLDLGSSTREFRAVAKPHIEGELFGPLEAAGVRIVHSDIKAAAGVDIVGDILDPAVRADLKARGFKSVLCSNLLEHVREPEKVAAACEEIVGPGGLILASVPSSYPYHADPIDTGFRPSPARLASLFARSEPLAAEEVAGRNYRDDIAARGSSVWKELAQTLVFAPLVVLRPKSFAARTHRWFWYRRPYRVAIALVRVQGGQLPGTVTGDSY